MRTKNVLATGLLLFAALCRAVFAQDSMSLNSEVTVVPAPGTVKIDGDTTDWDLSAGVWSYNNPMIAAKYSVWTHMMWDAKGIYFLARFADPTPMQNPTMGKDFSTSWKDDCYQARIVFDDGTPDEHQMHVNMFYSAAEKKPYMIVKHGGFMDKAPFDDTGPNRPDQLKKWDVTMDNAGGVIAHKKWDSGKGYNCEAFWPWSYCRTSGQPMAAAQKFTFGIEALWDGHRLADGIKNAQVNRIFMFRSRNGWGKATISNAGNLKITTEQEQLHAARAKAFADFDTYGSIDLSYNLALEGQEPGERDVTIAIDDASGKRVRNLFGQYPRKPGPNKDLWDGLDDDGKPITPGKYSVTVVDHKPVELKFVNSLYNAGTPPWLTPSGRKLWGANHGSPTALASRKDVLLVGFTGVEGATGLLRANENAIIQWTDMGEVADVTMDDQYAYVLSPDSWIQKTVLRRFDLETGRNVPFEDTAKSVHVQLPIDYADTNIASTVAVTGGKVYALLIGKGGNQLVSIDTKSGAIGNTPWAAEKLAAITLRDETVYGLRPDGTVVTLVPGDANAAFVFKAEGVKKPVRLAVSHDRSRFAISDQSSNQVSVFDAAGKPFGRIGQAYEAVGHQRPAGKFIDTNLVAPLGLTFDSKGRLWIAEAEGTCRRVTVWGGDASRGYALQHQYWGGADYGAMAGFAVTFDSTRFLAHGVEFRLDPKPDIMNRPTQEKPLVFHPELAHERGLIYRYRDHEYAVTTPGYNGRDGFLIAKRNADGVFVPCVKVSYPHREKKDDKVVMVAGRAWVDRNDNDREDGGEVVENFADRSAYWSTGWTRPDLTIITASLHVYQPATFSPGGVPQYDFAHPQTPANKIPLTPAEQGSTGTIVFDDAGNISDGISFHTADGKHGKYPNLYARHSAPAAQRGLLIAPFRANGVVENVPGVGAITALGGDRGEWFLISFDGIYITSILQDSKGDITLDDTFTGQESFGGFIWKDETGRTLVQLGGPSYRIMEVKGLETTRKQVLSIDVSSDQIDAGRTIAAARMNAAGAEPRELFVAHVPELPTDAPAVESNGDAPLIRRVSDVVIKEKGNPSRWFNVAMAHDDKDLTVLWRVADASPWKNSSNRYTHAFIGGDCVDLKLEVPGRGPMRLLVAPIEGKDTVVYSQARAAKKDNPVTYIVGNNPANATNLDLVIRMPTATVKSKTGMSGYSVLLRVPLAELGIDPGSTQSIKGTAGVIYSDPAGTNRVARMYWYDKATDLVSDVPTEARLDASKWGKISFGK